MKRLILSLLLVLALIGVCIPQTAVFAADPNWYDLDWSYRKQMVVGHSDDGAQTNYQIPVVVHRSAGADSAGNVYVDDDCQADYDDIRFTNNTGSLLDYWIESYDANTATIWVELDSVGASGDTYFWIYYGHSDVAGVSDGEDTWQFFDDFPGSSLDTTNKWNLVNTVTVGSSHLTLTGIAANAGDVRSQSTFSKPLRFGDKVQMSVNNASVFYVFSLMNNAITHYDLNYTKTTANQITTSQAAGGAATTNYITYSDITQDHVYMQTWQTNEVLIYQDGTLKATRTSTIPTENMLIFFYEGTTVGATANIDWVYIGKFTDDDLAADSWGSQQSPAKPTVTTSDATNIAATTVTLNGNVTNKGYLTITTRGCEYGTVSGTYTDNVSEAGAWGTGTFGVNETGLTFGTTYYFRAWATNALGTGFGAEKSFTTLTPLPLPPTNLAGALNSDNVDLTWTKGTYAENTTIIRNLGHFPVDLTDGVEVYDGPLALFTDDLGADTGETEVYYSFWSVNDTGTSLTYSTLQVGGAAMAAALGAMTNVFIFMVLCFLGVALLGLSWWFRVGAMAIIAAVLWFVFGCYGVATGLMTDASLNTILGIVSVLIAFVAAFLPMLWRKPTLPEEEDDYTSIGEERDAGGEPDMPIDDNYGRPVRTNMNVPRRQIREDNRRYARKLQRRREAIEP